MLTNGSDAGGTPHRAPDATAAAVGQPGLAEFEADPRTRGGLPITPPGELVKAPGGK